MLIRTINENGKLAENSAKEWDLENKPTEHRPLPSQTTRKLSCEELKLYFKVNARTC